MKKHTDLSIQTLRGFAVFFIVMAHVIGYNRTFGMHVGNDSFYRYLYYTLQFLRIPLFTTISGFVYCYRPLKQGNLGLFLTGKVRRILIPLVTGTVLKYYLNLFATRYEPGSYRYAWKFFLYPFGHLWFLQTIFLVFLCISFLELAGMLKSFRKWSITLLITFVVTIATRDMLPNFFSFENLPYLLFFFLMGVGLFRFPERILNPKAVLIVSVVFIAGVVFQQLNWFLNWNLDEDYKSVMGFWVSISGMLVFFRFRKNIPFIAKLGSYSYAIYLYHLIGTSGIQLLFRQLNIHLDPLIFVAAMTCGVGIPIFLEREVFRHPVTRLIFLGLRIHKKTKE